MKILAIESRLRQNGRCDYGSPKREFSVLSNVVFSQIDIHQKYGRVVPEIASRHHIEKITYVLEEALTDAKVWYKISIWSPAPPLGTCRVFDGGE